MANDETTGLLAKAERDAWQIAASRLLDLSNRYGVPAEVYAAALDAVRVFGNACEAAAEARGVATERARWITAADSLVQHHEIMPDERDLLVRVGTGVLVLCPAPIYTQHNPGEPTARTEVTGICAGDSSRPCVWRWPAGCPIESHRTTAATPGRTA